MVKCLNKISKIHFKKIKLHRKNIKNLDCLGTKDIKHINKEIF